MSVKCELVELPSQPALSIRLRTAAEDLPQVFGKGYVEIAGYIESQQAEFAGPPYAIYYNMDMQDLDVEFGFAVSESLAGKDHIKATETPGGKFASCLHIGPYSEVEPIYNTLFQWMADKGYEASGGCYELYLNDPNETPPEEIETQIYIPIKTD